MNSMNRKNILILDPERDIGELFARALETRKDCKCYLASNEEEASDLLRDISFGLMLVDMGTAMAGDFKLLKNVRRQFPEMVIVVDAYLHQKQTISRAIALGVHGYIIKPIKVDLFRKRIDEICVVLESRVM